MNCIVGLTGSARAGKDHSALALKDMLGKHGIRSVIASSSDTVREHAAQKLSERGLYIDAARAWVNDDVHKDNFKDMIGMTPRRFTCQEADKAKVGDPFFFIKQWKKDLPEDADVIINSSIRTHDEADVIRELGGFFVDVQNPLFTVNPGLHFTEDNLGLNHSLSIENTYKDGLQKDEDKIIFDSCIQSVFKYTVERLLPDAVIINDCVLVPTKNDLFKDDGLYEVYLGDYLYGVHLSDGYHASNLFNETQLYHIDTATLVKTKVNFAVVNDLGVPVFSEEQMALISKATRDNLDCLPALTELKNGAPVLSEKEMRVIVYEGFTGDLEPS